MSPYFPFYGSNDPAFSPMELSQAEEGYLDAFAMDPSLQSHTPPALFSPFMRPPPIQRFLDERQEGVYFTATAAAPSAGPHFLNNSNHDHHHHCAPHFAASSQAAIRSISDGVVSALPNPSAVAPRYGSPTDSSQPSSISSGHSPPCDSDLLYDLAGPATPAETASLSPEMIGGGGGDPWSYHFAAGSFAGMGVSLQEVSPNHDAGFSFDPQDSFSAFPGRNFSIDSTDSAVSHQHFGGGGVFNHRSSHNSSRPGHGHRQLSTLTSAPIEFSLPRHQSPEELAGFADEIHIPEPINRVTARVNRQYPGRRPVQKRDEDDMASDASEGDGDDNSDDEVAREEEDDDELDEQADNDADDDYKPKGRRLHQHSASAGKRKASFKVGQGEHRVSKRPRTNTANSAAVNVGATNSIKSSGGNGRRAIPHGNAPKTGAGGGKEAGAGGGGAAQGNSYPCHQCQATAEAETASNTSSGSTSSGSKNQRGRTSPVVFKDAAGLAAHIKKQHTRPFVCVFNFAGCGATFASKNEWKRHVASQHLLLNYWLCTEGDCAKVVNAPGEDKNSKRFDSDDEDLDAAPSLPNGAIFNRKDLFTQHLRRMHTPVAVKRAVKNLPTGGGGSSGKDNNNSNNNNNNNNNNNKKSTASHPAAKSPMHEIVEAWEARIRDLQASALQERCELPAYMACPAAPLCTVEFRSGNAWDMRMEHVAKHLEKGCAALPGSVDGSAGVALAAEAADRAEAAIVVREEGVVVVGGVQPDGGNNGGGGGKKKKGGASTAAVAAPATAADAEAKESAALTVVFGGREDPTLMAWAASAEVKVVVRRRDGRGWELFNPLKGTREPSSSSSSAGGHDGGEDDDAKRGADGGNNKRGRNSASANSNNNNNGHNAAGLAGRGKTKKRRMILSRTGSAVLSAPHRGSAPTSAPLPAAVRKSGRNSARLQERRAGGALDELDFELDEVVVAVGGEDDGGLTIEVGDVDAEGEEDE